MMRHTVAAGQQLKGAKLELQQLWAFCAVAQHGSYTAAAKHLGLDKSKVSRDVRTLEERVATTLLLRNTRNVKLTPEGQALYERASPAFAALQAAVAGAAARQETPMGEVRLTTTAELGRVVLTPVLAAFRARYPQVSLVVSLDAALADFTKDGVDLALRVGRPGSNELTARKLGELRSGFFAAPAYLGRRGLPTAIEHLGAHDGLWPTPPKGRKAFAFGGKATAPVVECDDFEMLRDLARHGAGIALLPEFVAAKDEQAGALVRVLPAVALGGGALFLVSRAPRQLPKRVSVLRQYLLEVVPRGL